MLEVALATMAVVGAGLFDRSFRKVSAVELGFDPDGVQKAELYLASAGYTAGQEKLFCRRLKQEADRNARDRRGQLQHRDSVAARRR
jgi:hypothetical protein